MIKQFSFIIFAFLLGAPFGSSHAATGAPLVIVSPLLNAKYNPGDSFIVTVNHNPTLGTAFFDGGVQLQASGTLRASEIQSFNPSKFTVSIPLDTLPGTYQLTAMGVHLGSGPVFSDSINILVQASPSAISAIYSDVQKFVLPYPGAFSSISINARTVSGTIPLPPGQITFVSEKPSIVSVDAQGVLTALSAGSTVVHGTYGGLVADIFVSVAAPLLRGDFNGDNKIDQDDINILSASLNQAAVGPNDARDLNKDGKIDALDLRMLTTLCSRPRCVTQ